MDTRARRPWYMLATECGRARALVYCSLLYILCPQTKEGCRLYDGDLTCLLYDDPSRILGSVMDGRLSFGRLKWAIRIALLEQFSDNG